MKKSLMATTALVAASVAVSGAYAQDDEVMEEEKMMAEPISLSMGGYAAWGVSLSSYDAVDSLGIANSVEVQFKGKTVLDNGLEVGVRVELEGEQQGGASAGSTAVPWYALKTDKDGNPVDADGNVITDHNLQTVYEYETDADGNRIPVKAVTEVKDNSDQIDEAYVYVSGSFGEIRIGNDDAVSETLSVTAPQATAYYGANSPSWTGTASPLFFSTKVSGDSASVMYFTPVVNGFQFGVSYAPEDGNEARNNVAGNPDGGENASAAFNYKGSIGEATGFSVGAGVVDIGSETGSDTTHVTAGMNLSRGAYAIGVSYKSTDDGSNEDEITYEMGAQYSSGPWGVSLNWSHNEDDDRPTHGGDIYRLLGSYSLGAGVTLAGGFGMDQPEDNTVDDARILGMALSVAF